MANRSQRLKRLVKLQEQIKALHETRHATYIAEANAARADATELLEALNAASPLPGLFPDLYNRRIGEAFALEEKKTAQAKHEAGQVATATARTNIVERAWREALRAEERASTEKEQLENVERNVTERK